MKHITYTLKTYRNVLVLGLSLAGAGWALSDWPLNPVPPAAAQDPVTAGEAEQLLEDAAAPADIAVTTGAAQAAVDEDAGEPRAVLESPTGEQALPLDDAELEALIGPIALYPDDLVAIVLPAATYPLQVAQAARFLDRLQENPELAPPSDWDDSVVALLNYPEVLRLMDRDLDWTWRLGQAVIAQESQVVAAVGRFRDRAYQAGNLNTDDRQEVIREEGVIEIRPADPEVIYVPYYEPERVVVVQSAPAYFYYPTAYPVYYYPYPEYYSFPSPWFWGVSTAFTVGWHSHHLHLHHHYYPSHPYYRWNYYPRHYTRHYRPLPLPDRRSRMVADSRDRYAGGDRWVPRDRIGSRPLRTDVERIRERRQSAEMPRVHRQVGQPLAGSRERLNPVPSTTTPATVVERRGEGWKERTRRDADSREDRQARPAARDERTWRRPVKERAPEASQQPSAAPEDEADSRRRRPAAQGDEQRQAADRSSRIRRQLAREDAGRAGLPDTAAAVDRRAGTREAVTPAASLADITARNARSTRTGSSAAAREDNRSQRIRRELARGSRAAPVAGGTGEPVYIRREVQLENRNVERDRVRENAAPVVRTRDTAAAANRSRSVSAPASSSRPAPANSSRPAPASSSRPAPASSSRPAPAPAPRARSESRKPSVSSDSSSGSSKPRERKRRRPE